MIRFQWRERIAFILVALLTGTALWVQFVSADDGTGDTISEGIVLTGQLFDEQRQPIPAAEVFMTLAQNDEHLAQTESQENGSWVMVIDRNSISADTLLILHIERHHFQATTVEITGETLQRLAKTESYFAGSLTLVRERTLGFWLVGFIFLAVLLMIAFEKMHSATASLTGLSVLFLITFIGGHITPTLYIFDFEQALTYINWEVIFLVMAMMIVIAIIEETGIFQWTAFQAYRLSQGRPWVLVIILMVVTAVASALLDNFTTMLLMAPISLQIAISLGINPLALIIPEVMASNVGGISTLIGTPTNILIGSYAGIGFTDFFIHQTIGVILALIVMMLYIVLVAYRQDLVGTGSGISPTLYERLKKNAQIENPNTLYKSGFVFVMVVVGFTIGEHFHVPPAVPALIGATWLLVWLKPNVTNMIKAVDWTTLVFFMALFMIVGAVQEVGMISLVGVYLSQIVGNSLPLAVAVIVFGVGTLSVAIANIPLAAAMLPIVELLSGSVPGANNKILYYALSMGAAMGGNGFLVGAAANLVTAGITEQAGSPISFVEFMRVGLPVAYLTLLVGFAWLAIHFNIFS